MQEQEFIQIAFEILVQKATGQILDGKNQEEIANEIKWTCEYLEDLRLCLTKKNLLEQTKYALF